MTANRQDPYFEGWPPGVKPPPRGIDLPVEDDVPMETPWHRFQMNLSIELFERLLGPSAYVGGNMGLYFSALQAKKNDFRSPDVFVVKDAPHNPDRLSWVVWEEEGRTPSIVIELLSESTESVDRGTKKRIYEKVLKVPDYFVYDPMDYRLEGWRLGPGGYSPIAPDANGRLWCAEAGVWLGTAVSTFLSHERVWLRLFDADGQMLPTYTEAEAARARAEAARADAEAARAQAEAARAQAAEARVAELMAELAKR